MRGIRRYLCSDHGATASEFALVAVPFVSLVLAIIALSFVLYSNMALQNATENAARCYRVDTTDCSTPAQTTIWANNHYYGLVPARFTPGSDNCGSGSKSVYATANMPFNIGVYSTTITLQGNACYP